MRGSSSLSTRTKFEDNVTDRSYSMMLDMFRQFSRNERERVLKDNRERKIRLTNDLNRVTEYIKLMEAEHTLLLLKDQ
jgi:hypothetical protein